HRPASIRPSRSRGGTGVTATAPPNSTTAADRPPDPSTAVRRRRRRRPFGEHVATEVARLQNGLGEQAPWAVAVAARLRAAAARPPGAAHDTREAPSVPPPLLGSGAAPAPADRFTETELAKHPALPLYALHQQSRHEDPMHRDGPSIGESVSLL